MKIVTFILFPLLVLAVGGFVAFAVMDVDIEQQPVSTDISLNISN